MEKIDLSGISFGILESNDIWNDVLTKFKKDPRSPSVYGCYTQYPQLADHTRTALKRSYSIAADFGKYLLIHSAHEEKDFKFYYEQYLTCPVSFSSFEIWALIQVAQQVELSFLKVCSTPNNEVQLSGHLIQLLSSKSELVQDKYSKYLSRLGASLNVKKLELQVQKREKVTGGDFALLFEWKDSRGDLKICPVIFQAKRSVSENVDISQENPDSGSQLAILSKSKCNASFIFYNCDSLGILAEPRLPTVKSVSSIVRAGLPLNTSSIKDSLSLSIFMLDVMGENGYFVTSSRKEALNAILPGAGERELADVITFSVDPEALREYQHAYKEYLTAKLRADQRYGDDGPGN